MPNYYKEENQSKENETETSKWVQFSMRMGVNAALHPFEYSRVLIQLGYEPIPAVPARSIIGRRVMGLPNIFQYAGHIRMIDGFWGCYRGLTPKLVGSICSMIFSEKIADKFGLHEKDDAKDDKLLTDEELMIFSEKIAHKFGLHEKDEARDNELLTDEKRYLQFKINLKRDLILSVSGIIISQPFHVVSVRMMAQFIGREHIYNSILGSFAEIYKTEGIFGFFSGIIPKLLADVACLVLTSSTIYLLNKYVVKDTVSRQYTSGLVQFAYSGLLYPFNVVATCMTVTGTRLKAGQPPIMPKYNNWISCFSDLHERNELKRGSSVFWRTAAKYRNPTSYSGSFAPLPTLAKYQ